MRRSLGFTRLILPLFTFAVAIGAIVYFGFWHLATLFLWQHPMLSWLPIVLGLTAGVVAGAVRQGLRATPAPIAAPPPTASTLPTPPTTHTARPPVEEARGITMSLPKLTLHKPIAFLVAVPLLVYGILATLLFPPKALIDDFSYSRLTTLPKETQPRLLPRTSVDDDPLLDESKEVHLVRDPATGGLLWTGEWRAGLFSGDSGGIALMRLDRVRGSSSIVRAGFDRAVSGLGPDTGPWKARTKHPFSRFQYPIIVPTGKRSAIAVISYLGYKGFPFRRPYYKGVLVYHQDGSFEDLSPEEAARRPELVRTGRLVPERMARLQAEAIAETEAVNGKIVDGKGNRQPYLTSIDRDTTVWLTIINEKRGGGNVKALVFTDSSTGETRLWTPGPGERIISTDRVIERAESLPLRFKERRCCDSDGHSHTVTLREVVEPRLAFKDGRPYYLVTVAPTRNLPLSREVEVTLLIDARTGRTLDEFRHVTGGEAEDERLERFFERKPKRRKKRSRR